jgi:DmsE family decaheme c-type cytochrome
MHSYCRTLFRGVALAGLVAAWLVFAGTASAATSRAALKAPPAQQADYAGQDTCLGCHEDKGSAVKEGPHSRAFNPRTPAATTGCEACHGPGKAHAEAGGDKTKITVISALSPQAASELCTSCHNRATHALWTGSQHDQRNVGCTRCHSVHKAAGDHLLKAKAETDLCATCHRAITNKQKRFNHMPVREGKLTCTSCHNVHGSANVRLLKTGATANESCTSCHAEKRGPYLWQHAPVEEACTSCHDPHGTNNDRMLVAKQPFLCQRCHVTSRHPPTVYESYALNNSTGANRLASRSCVVCPQQIHGANAPSGKAFLR